MSTETTQTTQTAQPPQAAPSTMTPAQIAGTISAEPPQTQQTAQTQQTPQTENGSPSAGEARDSRGVAFDAAKFRQRDGRPQVDSQGRYVPLGGGRKRKTPVPQPPPAQTPETAWSAEEKTEAAKTAPLPENGAQPPPNAAGEAAAEPPEPPKSATPGAARKAAARAATRVLYTATGVVTGNHDEAIPPPAQDKELIETTEYAMEASGWQPGAKIAFVLAALGYVIWAVSQPKNREWLTRLLKPKPKTVTGTSSTTNPRNGSAGASGTTATGAPAMPAGAPIPLEVVI